MKTLILIMFALTVIGCGTVGPGSAGKQEAASGASGQTAVKRYPMHGKILSLNASDKSARIDAGPIGDWMGAMTMNYPVKDDAEFAKLTAGATIDATVFVDGDNFWIGEVKPAQ